MAKNKNKKKDGKVTAGDLFDKLKSKNEGGKFARSGEDAEEKYSENGFSIDVSSDEESDSELDINELLRKYMPEYSEEETSPKGGVLSQLKKKSDRDDLPVSEQELLSSEEEDDRLISALDSAFGPADEEAENEFVFAEDGNMPLPEEDDLEEENLFEDEPFEDEDFVPIRELKKAKEPKKKKGFSLFGRKSKKKAAEMEEELSAEPELPSETDLSAFLDEELLSDEADYGIAEAEALPVFPEEETVFNTADLGYGDIAELEGALNDTAPVNRSTPADRTAAAEKNDKSGFGDDLLERLEALERESEAINEPEPVAEPVKDGKEAVSGESVDAMEAFGTLFEDQPAEQAELSPEEQLLAEQQMEEEMPEEELPEEEDPTDLNLRVAFGMDGAEKKSSTSAAKQFGDQLEAKQHKHEKRVTLDRPEFVDKTQIPKLRKEYKSRLLSLWIKLGIASLFTIALMIFENVSFFTQVFTGVPQQFAGAIDPAVYPVVYIMVSLQLMLLACVCAYEQIIDGFKNIFRGTPKAESMTALLLLMGVLYSVLLARIIETPNEPVMFNFAVALSAVLTLVYSIYNTKRERMNFEVVAAQKPKHIVRRLPDEESMCEVQAFMEKTDACDVMKIEKTDFIDGFFGRMYQPDSTVSVFMSCMMGIVVALAVLFGFFINLRGGSGDMVLRGAYMTLLATAPLSVFITFSYPFYRATLAAKEHESAIIGEASLAEYSNASIISFDDKNVFPSFNVKIQNIKIFNNARVDRVLYYASSVFAYAGGPLQDVFEVATLEIGHSENVEIFETEAGFLATQVNGVNIIFGSYRALTSKGFEIPEEYAADDEDFGSELSIMYMFRENKLVAKMYVRYVMDGDIDLILKQFQGTGLYVCVRTFDPNIDERMIAKKLNMKKIPLKVVRYASTEEVTTYEAKVDSGLVTSSTPKSLLQVIAYCDKVLHTRKTNIALAVLSVIIGMAILFLLVLSNSLGIVNSLFIALYHLIWTVPMVVSAKMFIR